MESWQIILGTLLLIVLVIVAFAWLIDVSEAWEATLPTIQWQAIPVPPMRIKLAPNSGVDWMESTYVEQIQQLLRENGYERFGDYGGATGDDAWAEFRVEAYRNAEVAAVADILQIGTKVQLQLASLYEGDQVFAVTVASSLLQLDSPPWSTVEYLLEKELFDAPAQLLAQRPASGLLPAPSDKQYVELFEKSYAREMDWRMQRGGLLVEEVERLIEREGAERSSELIEAVQKAWRFRYNTFLDEELRANFRNEFHVADEEWNKIRYRLVFIHDKQTMWEIYLEWEPVYSCVYDPGDNQVYAQRCESLRNEMATKTPREAFAKLNELLERFRFEPYGVMSEPIAADVYLRPRGPVKGQPYLPA